MGSVLDSLVADAPATLFVAKRMLELRDSGGVAERVIRLACRRLPASEREARAAEWAAELPAILADPDRNRVRRLLATTAFTADLFRGAWRLAPPVKAKKAPAVAADPHPPVASTRVIIENVTVRFVPREPRRGRWPWRQVRRNAEGNRDQPR